MKIAVASGKGGTGKTIIATSLAATLAGSGHPVVYLDCDVEEPNGHIFLKPTITARVPFEVPVPGIDLERCSFCGQCADICRYNAIAVIGEKVLTFPELCHGCGGCYHICPDKAITEVPRQTGVINKGSSKMLRFFEGRLHVGEAQAPPLIRAVKEQATDRDAAVVIIDAPPGTSCPVTEAVRDCDYVLLVTEPTPFGLNDLELAVAMVEAMHLPFGVVINRDGVGDDRVAVYCRGRDIDVLLSIPHRRSIAEAYSQGRMPLYDDPTMRTSLAELNDRVTRRLTV